MARPESLVEAAAAKAGVAAGSAAQRIRQAEAALEETADDVRRAGAAAAQAANDGWTDFDGALRQIVRERPYTALAVAGLIGFLYAVARR
jgi:ElaB/YqjD/DUF883 family membrane-anchored ribosome-binding protein